MNDTVFKEGDPVTVKGSTDPDEVCIIYRFQGVDKNGNRWWNIRRANEEPWKYCSCTPVCEDRLVPAEYPEWVRVHGFRKWRHNCGNVIESYDDPPSSCPHCWSTGFLTMLTKGVSDHAG